MSKEQKFDENEIVEFLKDTISTFICHTIYHLNVSKVCNEVSCADCKKKWLAKIVKEMQIDAKLVDLNVSGNQYNPYWDSICKIAEQQRQKGLKEYGQGLEDNTELSTDERIKMVEEEMVDALMYLEHLRKGREEN